MVVRGYVHGCHANVRARVRGRRDRCANAHDYSTANRCDHVNVTNGCDHGHLLHVNDRGRVGMRRCQLNSL